MIDITVKAQRLTDGSLVHNVHVGELVLHAVTEDGATHLAELMRRGIVDNTVDHVRVIYSPVVEAA
jgi:hypothetical protein